MIVGIGVDVVECERMRSAMARHGEAFINRICLPDEKAYCRGNADPVPHVAARFAAKEAARKALAHTGPLAWHDVEVVRADDGAVTLRFHGKAAEGAHRLGVRNSFVSLAHERGVAIAMVVLES